MIAGAMDDHFELDDVLDRRARYDGGGGYDSFDLGYGQGVYRAAPHSFQNIEEIEVFENVDFILNDANTPAGHTLTINYAGIVGRSATVDAHHELDAHLHMTALFGGADDGAVNYRGGHLSDLLEGGGYEDTLAGGDGADTLSGGDGADLLTGGKGADLLAGGEGADRFIYLRVGDSRAGHSDLIQALRANDVIDLSAVDADRSQAGDQAFRKVDHFTGRAGELTLSYHSGGGFTVLAGDTDGDGKAEFVIHLTGDHWGFDGIVL